MTAAKLVLEPVFEAQFTDASHGFRPKRSAIGACEAGRVAANQGREWVFEAGIRDSFGTIDHDAPMAQLGGDAEADPELASDGSAGGGSPSGLTDFPRWPIWPCTCSTRRGRTGASGWGRWCATAMTSCPVAD